MISVLLLGSSTPSQRPATSADVVRTLSALVPGAVEGIIRDVQLLATAPEPDLGRVAEHAGCAYVAAEFVPALTRAVAAARSPLVLVLLAGVSFDRVLTDEMADLVGRDAAALGESVALKVVASRMLGRLFPRFAPTVGVLTEKTRLEGARSGSVPALWRTLRPRSAFKTRAWTAM